MRVASVAEDARRRAMAVAVPTLKIAIGKAGAMALWAVPAKVDRRGDALGKARIRARLAK